MPVSSNIFCHIYVLLLWASFHNITKISKLIINGLLILIMPGSREGGGGVGGGGTGFPDLP